MPLIACLAGCHSTLPRIHFMTAPRRHDDTDVILSCSTNNKNGPTITTYELVLLHYILLQSAVCCCLVLRVSGFVRPETHAYHRVSLLSIRSEICLRVGEFMRPETNMTQKLASSRQGQVHNVHIICTAFFTNGKNMYALGNPSRRQVAMMQTT